MRDLTAKQIIRNINISILSEGELKEPFSSIYSELKEVFSDLNIYTSDEHPHISYYGLSKDDLYIRYESKNENIWLDSDNVWSKFDSKFDLSYEHIQGITTWYLGNTFQMKGTTNILWMSVVNLFLGNTFQMKGTTNWHNYLKSEYR